jgi:hypothetical protein
MKKKFAIGLIALLSVSFIFFGCGDSGSGGGSGYSAAEIAAQELGDNLAALVGDPSKVAVSGTTVTVSASFTIDTSITEDIVIETGVILVLGENVTFTTEKDITVNGAVTLETGASVVGDTALKVIIGTGATVTGGENFYTAAEVQITEPVTAGTYEWDATLSGWKAQVVPILAAEIVVEVPATGGTPAGATTAGTGYTGAVTWADDSDNPAGGTFAVSTVYVATITLTPAAGYSFDDTTLADFTVAGVDDVSDGTYTDGLILPAGVEGDGTVIIKAIFPETVPLVIAAAEIVVEVPATGGTPAGTTTAGTGYTGAVTWADDSDNPAGGTFAVSTVYVATITLTPDSGYSFDDITLADFTVAGVDSVSDGTYTDGLILPAEVEGDGTVIIKAIFPETVPLVIAAAEIVVEAPTNGGTPAGTTTAGTGYTGAVTWADDSDNPAGGTFAASTVYVATITLTPDAGYTFDGTTLANFTVADVDSVSDGTYTDGLILPAEVEGDGTVVIKAIFAATGS